MLLIVLQIDLHAQTEEAVRQAVADIVGLTSTNDEARHKMRRWGNAALPFLEIISLENEDDWRHQSNVVVSTSFIDSHESLGLLIDILGREKSFPPGEALSTLRSKANRGKHRKYLAKNDTFHELVLGRMSGPKTSWLRKLIYGEALSPSSRDKCIAVEIVGALGWREDREVVAELLDDPDLSVRRAAAATLKKLEGREVHIVEPETSFPREDLDEDLLTPMSPESIDGRALAFVEWGGQPCLAIAGHGGSSDTVSIVDGELDVVVRLTARSTVRGCTAVPLEAGSAEQQLVIAEGHWRSEEVVAHAEDGRELWRYGEDGRTIESIAPLYADGETIGLLVGIGGEAGVVALDLAGAVLWSLPERHVVYEVASHPDLDRWAICGGTVEWVDGEGTPVSQLAGGGRSSVYASHVLVLPEDEEAAHCLRAGKGPNSVPTIDRVDGAGRRLWSATLPYDANGLCFLEAAASPRLLATVTKAGEVLVFDDDGVLRFRDFFFTSNPSLLEIRGGRLGDARCLALSASSTTFLYRVDPATDPGLPHPDR